MKIVGIVNTGDNKHGLFCLSYEDTKRIIAFPDAQRGKIKIRDIDEDRSYLIEAHRHPVQCIAMDYMGNLLASASSKGTLVRVFLLDGEGKCIQEVRRGIDNASISSINFSLTGELMGVSSDSGTVHIYRLRESSLPADDNVSVISGMSEVVKTADLANQRNKKSKLRFLRKAFSYFKSEWSFSNIRVKEREVYIDFNTDASDVIIFAKPGKIYRAAFELGKKGKKNSFKVISKVNLVYGDIVNVDE